MNLLNKIFGKKEIETLTPSQPEAIDGASQNKRILRHLKSGKLSRNSDKLIDKAELLRVYGALVSHEDNKQTQNDIDVITMLQNQVAKAFQTGNLSRILSKHKL